MIKPKYCQECCLQGHNEASCWNIYPELLEQINKQKDENVISKEGGNKEKQVKNIAVKNNIINIYGCKG